MLAVMNSRQFCREEAATTYLAEQYCFRKVDYTLAIIGTKDSVYSEESVPFT